MSRLASQAKGGYYATPPEMGKLICRWLKVEEGARINILDPCCGNGDIMAQFKDHFLEQGAVVKAYGNELERSRYEEACTKLDVVVHGGYESLRTTPDFSFLWGNPPYDQGALERMEVTFTRLFTARNERRKLQKGAVVGLCVPQYVLTDLAPVVASRLDEISVFRFTDEFYPLFKQVVLFGIFNQPSKEKEKKVARWLKRIGKMGPEAVLPLDSPKGKVYQVPPATGEVGYFRGAALSPIELLKDLKDSPVFDEVRENWMPSSVFKTSKLKRPILPLKPAHIAIAIASGAVDGHMGNFVIEAHTRIEIGKETTELEQGGESVRVLRKPVTVTRVFHPEYGIFDLK
jgi:hypothetical protein